MPGDLDGTRRRCAEPEQAEPAAGLDARHPQRTQADRPTTQQRRRGEGIESVGQAVQEVGPRGHPLGEAAVTVPSGEPRLLTQVLPTRGTEPAGTAGRGDPRHPDPLADVGVDHAASAVQDGSYDLVPGDDRQRLGGQIALAELQIGSAHATGLDPHQHVLGPDLGFGDLDDGQWTVAGRLGLAEQCGSHEPMFTETQPSGQLRRRAISPIHPEYGLKSL